MDDMIPDVSASYRNLLVWQRAIELVTDIYRATSQFPAEEMYGLKSQLRRAAVSIPSNIAEGQGRATPGEFRHFLGIARGSLLETETQIHIAQKLAYISREDEFQLLGKTRQLLRMLTSLANSISAK
jgi:four helix bundle protein